jgi:exo-1,4-beta-D-glucosaminidase
MFVCFCLTAWAIPLLVSQESVRGDGRAIKIDGWTFQTSSRVSETGEMLSAPGSRFINWHAALVPGTLVGSLANDNLIPDPNYGVNLRNLIGPKFESNKEQNDLPMDPESPFAVPWWYRTEFSIPDNFNGKTVWLHFGGINYRADVWVNGHQIADSEKTVGAWREYEFDITKLARIGAQNAIAVKVQPPTHPYDLAISYVDWNPGSPDRGAGLFREVSLIASGPVALRFPAVISHVDLPEGEKAHLTVTARLVNSTDKPQAGTFQGRIEQIEFSQKVELRPREVRDVVLEPKSFAQLNIEHPRLWWPAQMGTPNLYKMEVEFDIDGHRSDAAEVRFGIREITSELDAKEHRLFRVNGKKVLIRGGGWAMDMWKPKSQQRLEDEFRYVKNMGLNTIRLEGMLEPKEFFDLADREGILVMAGWTCALWETWSQWKDEQVYVAEQSLRSQILRLRSHPSIVMWVNGSDYPPPPKIEQMYLDIEKEYLWPNPIVSSVTAQDTPLTGKTGVKETGPYDYVVPPFWLGETGEDGMDRGGAFGFNTETGPGPAIPPIETLREVLPKEHLWPIDDWWTFHAGLHDFKDFHVFIRNLNQRYGEPADLDDFLMKAQMMRYEAVRAMYEAFNRNKYSSSTGVIAWLLNNSWPSFIWNLYDYKLRTAGGYFGAKNALEPLHPMYAYDDHAIWVTSSQYQDAKDVRLTATIYDSNMKERFTRSETLDIAADSTNKAFPLPEVADLTPVYFLALTLHDTSGKLLGSNFYWFSNKPETITHGTINIHDGFGKTFADYRGLSALPKTKIVVSSQTRTEEGNVVTHIHLRNDDRSLAFFVRLNLNSCATEKEVLPVVWSDNYVSFLPGESREVTGSYRGSASEPVRVEFYGWNVDHATTGCPEGTPKRELTLSHGGG